MSQSGTPDFARGLVVLCRVASRTDGDGFGLPNDASGDDARALARYVVALADGGAFAKPLDARIPRLLHTFAMQAVGLENRYATGQIDADAFDRMLTLAFSFFLADLRGLS